MSKLVPLREIPYFARAAESAARKAHPNKESTLAAAPHRLVVAQGCHSNPYFDPPIIGWVLTQQAAEACASRVTRMPGGSSHHRVSAELNAG